MKKFILTSILLTLATLSFAQRFTDKLDRGLVAVPCNEGNFISWRVLGEEYYDVTYNLYCNGSRIATNLSVSNYTDKSGTASSSYQVAAVVRGVEQPKCKAVNRWENGYWDIPVARPTDRNGNYADDYYTLNDVTLGDLTGNGVVEFIVKRPAIDARNHHDPQVYQNIHFNQLDCYDLSGNRLWWIDLGPNMISGPDEQWDCVAYDWDMDGKAEVVLRCQDGAIIHYADGTTETIGDPTLDTRNTVEQRNGDYANMAYTNSGDEYLLYLEGATGRPYEIGPSTHPHYMSYPISRGNANNWGDGYGHRSTKHYFGAPYLDGRKPSIFIGRGCYTQHKFAAYDVDPTTHQLTQRRYWENTMGWDSPWYGNGYHNFAIGDVDWDGRDEIIFGSMVIDDNGKGLSTTGLGHGDAQHCSDFDPYRKYEEQFACNEDEPNMNYRNATTAEIYYRSTGTGDDGRALCGNFSNKFPGSMGRTLNTGLISTVADKEISGGPATGGTGDALYWSHLNQRIYWDGDLLDEVFDSPGSNARAGAIYKPDGGRLFNADGSNTNNGSKNNPGAIADIFGDWREELVMRAGDTKLRIYTTNIPTDYRIPTLWSDHQYRNAMVWQSIGYNQPPHKSYFLGELEGITQAPPTNTMTGRTEVANGGTITTTDDHLLVCETNNTTVSIQDGASPYMVTFNVPSHVQGNADSNTSSQPAPTYKYYTCEVTGGALTGNTRLVKQGDGILKLPKVNMTYTGNTDVWAGTLEFDGSMKQSDLWLNRFAELNSNGGEFKSIKADYASVIRPGGKNAVGTITTTNYTMGFGSRLVLDLYSEEFQADQVITNQLTIENKLTDEVWMNYGPQYLQPIIEVVEHRQAGAKTLEPGDYIIGQVDEVNGSLDDIKIEGVTNLSVSLSVNSQKQLILTVSTIRAAGEVIWTGAKSATWDFAKTANFYLSTDDTKTPDTFVKGDIVNFTDEGVQTAIAITEELKPKSIIVNASEKDYSISGNGSITSGSLVKEGTKTLTISTENSYKGGNALKGGTVVVSSLSNENKATGNLGGVTVSANSFTMENGATIKTTATVTNGSPIKFVGEQGGVIYADANKDFIQNKTFSGTLLTKKGSGWVKTYSDGASLNRAIIIGGAIDNHAGNAAKVVEFQGGALNDGVATNNELYIPSGKSGTWNTANRATYTNKITGEGTLDIYCAGEQGSGWVATRTPLQLNLSEFKGTIVPHASIAADGRFTLDTSSGSADCTFNIPENVIVQNSGRTFRIGQLTGKGTLGGFCSFQQNVSAKTNTWEVGNDKKCKFEGIVTSNDYFTKLGTGEMNVTGNWDCTGAVNISEGSIRLGEGGALGSGSLTVAENASLTGISNSAVTLANSNITINGTVQPGESATATSGNINFGGKNVTVSATGKLVFGLRRSATEYAINNAYLKNIGTLKLAAGTTISVVISQRNMKNLTTDEEEPDVFHLWTDVQRVTIAGDLNFDLPQLAEGQYWDTSHINEGILYVRYKATTDIAAIPAGETVTVEVVNANGITVETFSCPMNNVSAVFAKTSLPKGVYLLRLQSETGKKGSIKLMK